MTDNTILETQEESMETTEQEKDTVVEGKYLYDKDTFKFHRFRILADEGIGGSIYIPKTRKTLPKRLILKYFRSES